MVAVALEVVTDLEVAAEEEGEVEEEVSLEAVAAAVVADTVDGKNFLEATTSLPWGNQILALTMTSFTVFVFYLYSFTKCGGCNFFLFTFICYVALSMCL